MEDRLAYNKAYKRALRSESESFLRMSQFKTGDVVRLKSGGPKMTVKEEGDSIVSCQWFDRNGKTHTDKFQVVMLEAFIVGKNS